MPTEGNKFVLEVVVNGKSDDFNALIAVDRVLKIRECIFKPDGCTKTTLYRSLYISNHPITKKPPTWYYDFGVILGLSVFSTFCASKYYNGRDGKG